MDDNLEVDGRPIGRPLDLNSSLRDAGVSSVDFVAFAKVVAQEFNVTFTLEDCAKYKTLGELIEFPGRPVRLVSRVSGDRKAAPRESEHW